MEEISIWRTKYFAMIPKDLTDHVRENHPNKEISVYFNTNIELNTLSKGESVRFGDGDQFMFILKKL